MFVHECWWCIVFGISRIIVFVIQNGWCDWQRMIHEIFTDNNKSDACWTKILLCSGVNNSELKVEKITNQIKMFQSFIGDLLSERKKKRFPTLVISNGLEKMFDDISTTNGTPFVSGMNGNSTPAKRETKHFIHFNWKILTFFFDKKKIDEKKKKILIYRQQFHCHSSTRMMRLSLNSMWIDQEWLCVC